MSGWGSFFNKVVEAVAPPPAGTSSSSSSIPPPSHGYRVLKLSQPAYPVNYPHTPEHSPKNECAAAKAGLEPLFDYITHCDGVELTNDASWLQAYISQGASDVITLRVFSLKGNTWRQVRVPPGALTSSPIGATLRWSPTGPAIDHVFHVTSVTAGNSPAWQAGLLEEEDYIVGTPLGLLRGESALAEYLEDHLGNGTPDDPPRPAELLVWNRYTDILRLVPLTPSRTWGGKGIVGFGLGTGVLHRLPRPLHGRPADEGEDLFRRPDSIEVSRAPGGTPAPANTSAEPSAGGKRNADGGDIGGFQTIADMAPPTRRGGNTRRKDMRPTTQPTDSAAGGTNAKRPGLSEADIDAMLAEAVTEENVSSRAASTAPPPATNTAKPSTEKDGE
ncbi:hypothetical protein PYCC9005_003847 [Savitreella phatthalungensis]